MRFRIHQKKRHTMVYTDNPDDYLVVKSQMFDLARQINSETGKAVEINIAKKDTGVEAFVKHPDAIGARLSDKNITDVRAMMLTMAEEAEPQITEPDPRLSESHLSDIASVIDRIGAASVQLPHPDLEYDPQQKKVQKKA